MTHQEIVDAMKGLSAWHSEIYKQERVRIDAERDRLQGECDKVGHIFGEPILSAWGVRACVVCQKREPIPNQPKED